MTHAYNEFYLSNAKDRLSAFFDYAINDCKMAPEWITSLFVTTGYAEQFERGNPAFVAGMSGVELAQAVILKAYGKKELPQPTWSEERSPEYWAGWALARYQWYTALSFAAIDEIVPIASVIAMYNPFHEMDIRQFFDEMNKRILSVRPDTNLKRLRIAAGFSQDDLARLSGVPVRMIQHYEQRVKSINRAAYETVAQLAQALRCHPESLAEGVLPGLDCNMV